ncbi:MAG: BamA/TamA family outer membrane protein [Bacteroidetes bacterium]|nr:BamA/TamA family outer membrane protein [Bacteroidota bacterium]
MMLSLSLFPSLKRWALTFLITVTSLSLTFSPVQAQTVSKEAHSNSSPATTKRRVRVVANDTYRAGWLHRFLFGSKYRDVWATPIEVEVLDLSVYAGGLTLIRGGGMGQSKTLHLRGADGRRYVFRPVNKEILLPEIFDRSIIQSVIQDLKVSAFHPAAALVAAPLSEALDILHVTPRLYVMPDAPPLDSLSEFYAGMLGQLEERPDDENEKVPGFAGAKRVAGTERLLEHLQESSYHRVDATAVLKVRLFDILLGDRDRHFDQWRWARYDEGPLHIWRPIPRDRDEAFVGNDGVIWSLARLYRHNITGFGYEMESVRGVTELGWDLDRLVLAELAKPTWDSLATLIQTQLTDAVIQDAVRQLPPEYYEQGGDELIRDLRHRRSLLHDISNEYYTFLSKEVELVATDDSEDVTITHHLDGSVNVAVFRVREDGSQENQPYIERHFYPDETRDIRLYLEGGDDRVHVVGAVQHAITVRVVGGGGDDVLTDTTGTKGKATRFYDYRGNNHTTISGTATIDTRKYERPLYTRSVARKYVLDWGDHMIPAPVLGFNTDHGLVLGGGIVLTRYGFRKYPYANRMKFRAAISADRRFFFEYTADYPEAIGKLWLDLRARISGVDPFRFFGFGNETTKTRSTNFHLVRQQKYTLEPSISLTLSPNLWASVGPVFKLINNREDTGRFLGDVAPDTYGSGWFTQLGSQAAVSFDTRDHHTAPSRGVSVNAGGSFYPALGDVTKTFGEAHGAVATYLSFSGALQPVLAIRLGAKKVWGRFPFHEAAFLGGDSTVRGLTKLRFAGDASVYGNAELRVRVSRFRLLAPTEWGLIALADGGRVFYHGESSSEWHGASGGGVWFAPLHHNYTFSVTFARSVEQSKIDLRAGFMF